MLHIVRLTERAQRFNAACMLYEIKCRCYALSVRRTIIVLQSSIVTRVLYIFSVLAASKDGETVIQNDMTYSLRHVEESWIHLLKAGGFTADYLLSTSVILTPKRFPNFVSFEHP